VPQLRLDRHIAGDVSGRARHEFVACAGDDLDGDPIVKRERLRRWKTIHQGYWDDVRIGGKPVPIFALEDRCVLGGDTGEVEPECISG
jgi:hypothetical protein